MVEVVDTVGEAATLNGSGSSMKPHVRSVDAQQQFLSYHAGIARSTAMTASHSSAAAAHVAPAEVVAVVGTTATK
jgi:hypothetical protein